MNKPETSQPDEEQEQSLNPPLELLSPKTESPEGVEQDDGEEEEETYEEGQEVDEEEPCEETPEEEEVKVEWPTGVPQASDKDLAKLSSTEGVGTVSTTFSVCLSSGKSHFLLSITVFCDVIHLPHASLSSSGFSLPIELQKFWI